MSNMLFSYEVEIYNRNFLNCAQRQSIVMLKRTGIIVDALFYSAQVSTDRICDFSLRDKQPKYDFSYDGLADDDFAMIGVKRENHFVDRFDSVRPILLDRIARDGFVLSACNLYYVPHRPEYYQKKDVLHFQTLLGHHPGNETWEVIDDNAAGILAHFSFDEAFLQSLYDTGLWKGYRSFEVGWRDPDEVEAEAKSRFQAERLTRSDSLALLTDIESHIRSDPDQLKQLGEAFSLLSGSRRCFAQFLRLIEAKETSVALADEISREAARMRDAFTVGQVSGRLNVASIRQRAMAIAEQERNLGDVR